MAEVDLERELFDAELERLTTRERDLRRRIEDLSTIQSESDILRNGCVDASHAARTGPFRSSHDVASPTVSTPSADGGDVEFSVYGGGCFSIARHNGRGCEKRRAMGDGGLKDGGAEGETRGGEVLPGRTL